MLFVLLEHIVIVFACLGAGFLLYQWMGRNATDDTPLPFINFFLTGLVSLTIITQVLALFLPVFVIGQSVITMLLMIPLLQKRREFLALLRHLTADLVRQPLLVKASLLLAWLTIAFITAGPTMMDDTESYHIQAVKWIGEYGTVPGLVHLHERFGFNSSWFSGIALFTIPSGHHNVYTGLNGLLSFLFLAWLITGITDLRKPALRMPLLAVLILSLLAWPLVRGNAATAGYDHVTMVMLVVLFVQCFNSKSLPFIELLLWPVYLFTVRIPNFPLLLLSLFALVNLWKISGKKSVGLSLALVLPFLARNVVLSGYLFYPSMAFDLFPVDWKADAASTSELLRFIKYYNRVNTGVQELDITAAMDFRQWTRAWFIHLFAYDKLVLIPGLAGIVGFVATILRKREKNVMALFAVVLVLQLVSWFLLAPDPRFVYGPLLCGVFMLGHLCFGWLIPYITTIRTAFIMGVFLIMASVAGYTVTRDTRSFPPLVRQVELPQPALDTFIIQARSVGMNNTRGVPLSFHILLPHPVNGNWNPRCYDTDLPCAYHLPSCLEMRGVDIHDGFRLHCR